MKYKAKIFISLRKGIKNNEGEAIQKSLHSLGYTKVSKFNIGKFITMDIDAFGYTEAKGKVEEMCKKLLANIVIEDYEFEIIRPEK
jgi:phosphoribosylformylglycinamidine synthase